MRREHFEGCRGEGVARCVIDIIPHNRTYPPLPDSLQRLKINSLVCSSLGWFQESFRNDSFHSSHKAELPAEKIANLMTIKHWRDSGGRFDSFKAKCKRAWNWTVLGFKFTVFSGIMVAIGVFFASTSSVDAHYTTINAFPAKIEALKSDLLARLSSCEGNTDASAVIIDTNNEVSVGIYKFQIKTVQFYEKSLYQKHVTREEAILIALNDAEASALAKDIIFNAGGIDNWHNCAKKLDLSAEVEVLNKLD